MVNEDAKAVRCPIGQEYCYLSCYWRQGNRCYFKSKRGKQISELTVHREHTGSKAPRIRDAHNTDG